jgi:integrase
MRIAKMGYSQRVTVKDEQGRVTSSWSRVRIVVPDGLSASLPPPYTSLKHLTKKVHSSVEHAEWTARALVDQARGWGAWHGKLRWLDSLCFEDRLRESPALLSKYDDWLDKVQGVTPARKKQAVTAKPVYFDTMIGLWGKNKGKQAVDNMKTKCGKFADWLRENAGHDDMGRVMFANGRDWRDDMIEEGELAPGSISNHLKLVKALFTYAFENEHIPANHIARVKYSPGDGEERDDFTSEERRLILTLARAAEPHIYWVNWICSFHGNRTGEIADASTLDIECIDGIWTFAIHTKNRSTAQRLKTPVSTRKIALHQAVLDEGFVDYRDKVRREYGDGPLFPLVSLDCYDRRVGKITTELSLWLRGVVGITDPRKPFYSHRHTATSYLRNTLGPDGTPLVKEDIERYILGHRKKGWHSGYGKRWFETLKVAVEVIPNPLADEDDKAKIPTAEAAE